jgi:hypothetical protein
MTFFDPLDQEILQRALEAACGAVRDNDSSPAFDSDEQLEAALLRELIEIACADGISDPEAMRDLLLSGLSGGCDEDETAG